MPPGRPGAIRTRGVVLSQAAAGDLIAVVHAGAADTGVYAALVDMHGGGAALAMITIFMPVSRRGSRSGSSSDVQASTQRLGGAAD